MAEHEGGIQVFRVLIADGDDESAAALRDALVQCSLKGEGLPEGMTKPEGMAFSVELCHNRDELDQAFRRKVHCHVTVLVIDGHFQDESFARFLLKSVAKRQMANLRIVWRHSPTNDEVVQCMRLGAWDYIDKNHANARHGRPCVDVVASVIEWYWRRADRAREVEWDQAVDEYVRRKWDETFSRYKGHFVALVRDERQDGWQGVALDEGLGGLYAKLQGRGRDLDSVSICWIDG